ncbi:MAG: hypothetical protein ACI91J_001458 [Yoonia sp.]|jgi:hypothetical protein
MPECGRSWRDIWDWGPAQEASGEDWMLPYLAELLDDPCDAVRFVARRSVRSREPYRDFEFDFQDQSESRRERAADLIEQWRSNRSPLLKGRADLLLDEFGDVVKWEFQRLLKFRDQRDMTLAE